MSAQRSIISASNIGRSFPRRRQNNVSRNFNDILGNILCLPPKHDRDEEEFWALRDVSLEIRPGDSIGVIGRNGSGKTTLMKLLSGLLAPTKGSVAINGEIQALINLGAGFNQRLSGRENILNGMRLRGINPKRNPELVEQIIDFAEIGAFIDGPVETYSSGMKSRLGFALCIFLKPDLIVIDEALSVGDLAFQNKCKLHLQAMKQKGVAMLLVSHSMTSIRQFCDRALWIHAGELQADGPVGDVTAEYLDFIDQETSRNEKSAPAQINPEPAKQDSQTPVRRPISAKVERRWSNQTTKDNSVIDDPDKSFLATHPRHGWERPRISENQVEELYGGYFESSGIRDFRAVILSGGAPASELLVNKPFAIEFGFTPQRKINDLNVSLVFHTKDGKRLSTISTLNGDLLKQSAENTILCRVSIPDIPFAAGHYVVTISVHEGNGYLWRDAILELKVAPNRFMVWNQVSMQYQYNVFRVSS
jgi:ABC-type polysaccharide/polyol phosphate transport system ATPase subunit